jgi:hypothetical protein
MRPPRILQVQAGDVDERQPFASPARARFRLSLTAMEQTWNRRDHIDPDGPGAGAGRRRSEAVPAVARGVGGELDFTVRSKRSRPVVTADRCAT